MENEEKEKRKKKKKNISDMKEPSAAVDRKDVESGSYKWIIMGKIAE